MLVEKEQRLYFHLLSFTFKTSTKDTSITGVAWCCVTHLIYSIKEILYFMSVRTQVFHDFHCAYKWNSAGRCCGGSEIHCLSCLIISTLFQWTNVVVPLQLLGRTVSDCLTSGGTASFECRRFTGFLCNQAIFGLLFRKNILTLEVVFSHRAETFKT